MIIKLRGSEAAVAAGKELVLEIIKDLPKTVTIQVRTYIRNNPFKRFVLNLFVALIIQYIAHKVNFLFSGGRASTGFPLYYRP